MLLTAAVSPRTLALVTRYLHSGPVCPVQLKLIFPDADAGRLGLREPALLLDADMGRVCRAAQELRALLPSTNIDL